MGETGVVAKLGVEVRITPENRRNGGIAGFWVEASYKDPVRSGGAASIVQERFIPASCRVPHPQEYGPYSRTNESEATFSVIFHQGCKEVRAGLSVPFLEAKILCSNPGAELRRIETVRSGRIFDITPTGVYRYEQTEIGHLVDAGRDGYRVYQEASSVISDVLLVFSVIALFENPTAEAFVLEAADLVESKAVGYVKGRAIDSFVNAAFDYIDTNYGVRVQYRLKGWDVFCRIGGHKFHRETLAEGELLKCPHGDAEAYIHFR
jgi:hypothetical protein